MVSGNIVDANSLLKIYYIRMKPRFEVPFCEDDDPGFFNGCKGLGTQDQPWNLTLWLRDEKTTATIDYCLSQEVAEHCELSLSIYFLTSVIIANILKLICFVLLLLHFSATRLITVGDAVANFITESDTNTIERPLESAAQLRTPLWRIIEAVFAFCSRRAQYQRAATLLVDSRQSWDGDEYRWFRAAGGPRWLATAVP